MDTAALSVLSFLWKEIPPSQHKASTAQRGKARTALTVLLTAAH